MNPTLHARNPIIPALTRGQSGFTLVELMISITIGLVIMVALLTVLVNLTRSNSEMAKTNSQIENGRFAIQLLQTDLVHAGFWGEFVPQFDNLTINTIPNDAPTAIPDPCAAYATGGVVQWSASYVSNVIGIPVASTDIAPTGCASVTNKQANTDVLVIRHAETCIAGSVGNCDDDTAGRLYFQSSLCVTGTTPYKLDTTGFTLTNRNCTTSASKRRFISRIFYIRDYASTVGDGIPTLMLSEFDCPATGACTINSLAHQTAIPLIEGIEGFRVEFGIDNLSDTNAAVNYGSAVVWANTLNLISPINRGDGSPDGAFVRCTNAAPCTVAQMTNVVEAKLYVLARSKESTPGYTDTKTYSLGGASTMCSTTSTDSTCALKTLNPSFKRHVYSTSVRLTNVSSRRETPP